MVTNSPVACVEFALRMSLEFFLCNVTLQKKGAYNDDLLNHSL